MVYANELLDGNACVVRVDSDSRILVRKIERTKKKIIQKKLLISSYCVLWDLDEFASIRLLLMHLLLEFCVCCVVITNAQQINYPPRVCVLLFLATGPKRRRIKARTRQLEKVLRAASDLLLSARTEYKKKKSRRWTENDAHVH